MVPDKTMLSLEEIDAQMAMELPDREAMQLVAVYLIDVLNNNTITINIPVNVVATVCAALLSTGVFGYCSTTAPV